MDEEIIGDNAKNSPAGAKPILDTEAASEIAVNKYRIERLEAHLKELEDNSETLNFPQIKQMFTWIGLPVLVATSVFGVSLWNSLQIGTISAAEERASQTVGTLTGEINVLQDRLELLQSRSQDTFEELRELRGRAEESARSVQRQADSAELRATEATRALSQLRDTAAAAEEIQKSLDDVEALANQLAANFEFSELVSQRVLTGLSGMVVAFDRIDGCPTGWIPFDAAAGRMIVGVDGVDYTLPYTSGNPDYQQGGSEVHTLSIEEMPRHRHYLATQRDRTSDGLSGNNALATRARRDSNSQNYTLYSAGAVEPSDGVTSYSGSNQPHNNMPPFVALYYCKKT